MIKTPLCDLLGISYPIIQGGMAWIADACLASAVSNGGGLGLISAMNADAEWLSGQIRAARELTDKPFGVNVMLMSPFAAEVAQAIIDEGVKIVTTGAGNPEQYMQKWLDAGITVMPVVPSTAIAKRMERIGAAAVIAEGGESGGHAGDLSTLALVPQVCDAVSIPVVAAGGIADGRGIAATFILGAVGVQVGTRFLVAEECSVHRNYKDKILKARDIDTMTTGRRLGHPLRALKTPFTREFLKREYDSTVTDEELEAFGVGSLRMAAIEGDVAKGSFLAGQVASMVNKEQPAAEIIIEMFNEAEKILGTAGQWVE